MKPGAHRLVFCTALQFDLLYNDLALEQKKVQDRALEFSSRSLSEVDES